MAKLLIFLLAVATAMPVEERVARPSPSSALESLPHGDDTPVVELAATPSAPKKLEDTPSTPKQLQDTPSTPKDLADIPSVSEEPEEPELLGVVVPANWPFYRNYYEGDLEEQLAPEPLQPEEDDMEVAENVVFRPLFRYRQRNVTRRRIRNSNRRNYIVSTYAQRYPYRYYGYPYRTNAIYG